MTNSTHIKQSAAKGGQRRPDHRPSRRPYRLVSADQHINEPPDLWTSRVARKYKSRVPQMKSFAEGDAWIIEGIKDPISFGINACAGLHPSEAKAWLPWNRVRKGGYIGKERLAEMDLDGVDAAIMFPTPRLAEGIIHNQDKAFQRELVRAYNDWIAEFVSYAPDRMFGMIWLPATGVKDAIAEFERCIEMPGMVGPMINCYPNGTSILSKDDDPLWRLLEQADIPLTIHVSLTDSVPGRITEKLPGSTRNRDAERRMLEMLWDGLLDRFPGFKVAFAEVDAGWVPFFKEQIDNRYHRFSQATNLGLSMPPSEYFDRHFHFAFITDAYAIRNREAVGLHNLMWSDDFPHIGGDWPYTQRSLSQFFADVPREHRELILAGNAARLYHLPGMLERKSP